MQFSSRLLRLVALSVLAAGCATRPAFDISSSGKLPSEGTFGLVAAEQAEPAYARLAAMRLEGLGLRRADTGKYALQVTLAQRPAGAGLFLPAQPDAWLRAPARSGSEPRPTLVLTLSERGTGREVYRIAVAGERPDPSGAAQGEALLQAAFDQMSGPVSPEGTASGSSKVKVDPLPTSLTQ